MEVTILGIAVLISKVAAVYGVSIGVTSGLQYYHDFKLTKKRKGRGSNDNSDFEGTISGLKRKLSESE